MYQGTLGILAAIPPCPVSLYCVVDPCPASGLFSRQLVIGLLGKLAACLSAQCFTAVLADLIFFQQADLQGPWLPNPSPRFSFINLSLEGSIANPRARPKSCRLELLNTTQGFLFA